MIAFLLSLLLSFPVYAASVDDVINDLISQGYVYDYETDTLWFEGEKQDLDYYLDFEEEQEHENDSEYFVATPSYYTGSTESLADYFLKLENDPVDIESAPDLESIDSIDSISAENGSLRAPLPSNWKWDDNYKNTVVFTGRFNNSSCRLVIPYDHYKSLTVVNGVLLNIGNNTITGRLLYGNSEITYNGYDTYSLILNPVYGSTSSVWSYGSYNYQRHYYLYTNSSTGAQSIRYSDTYGSFVVTDTDLHFATQERLYYLGLIGLLIVGVFVCLKR